MDWTATAGVLVALLASFLALALAEADLAKTQAGLPAQMTDPKVKELWNKFLSQSNQNTTAPAKK